MQAERDAIECELKSANADMKDVFLNALAQDGTINEIAISTESLGRLFGPLQKQVGCGAASDSGFMAHKYKEH